MHRINSINAGQVEDVYDIPNAPHLLVPKHDQDTYNLWQGLNVLRLKIDEKGNGWVCHECDQAL